MSPEFGLLTPEGLTEAQAKLADLLFDTKIVAPINRRRTLPDDSSEFYKIERPTSPIDFAQNDEEFALKLHEQTPDAPLSPVYINLRNLPEEAINQVGIALAEVTKGEEYDFCVGIPAAGEPIARSYSLYSNLQVRDDIIEKVQTHQGRRVIARGNTLGHNEKVLVIDDLGTKADTKLEAIGAIVSQGFKVEAVLVVVDRQQGAVGKLHSWGYEMRSVFTITQLLKYALRTGRVSQERLQEVMEYLHL